MIRQSILDFAVVHLMLVSVIFGRLILATTPLEGCQNSSFSNLQCSHHQYSDRREANSMATVSKRALITPTTTNNNMDAFMSFMWPRITDHMPINRGTLGKTIALARPFYSTDRVFGMDKLYGCTVLLVASRRGVYLAHYWDSPGFDSSPPVNQYEQDQRFDSAVLRSLERSSIGFEDPALEPLVSRQRNDSAKVYFAPGDNVKALVIGARRPASELPGDFLYGRYVNKLVARLRQMLPEDSWTGTTDYKLPYHVERNNPDSLRQLQEYMKGTAEDKLLFQYSEGHGYEVYLGRYPAPRMSDYWTENWMRS